MSRCWWWPAGVSQPIIAWLADCYPNDGYEVQAWAIKPGIRAALLDLQRTNPL